MFLMREGFMVSPENFYRLQPYGNTQKNPVNPSHKRMQFFFKNRLRKAQQ